MDITNGDKSTYIVAVQVIQFFLLLFFLNFRVHWDQDSLGDICFGSSLHCSCESGPSRQGWYLTDTAISCLWWYYQQIDREGEKTKEEENLTNWLPRTKNRALPSAGLLCSSLYSLFAFILQANYTGLHWIENNFFFRWSRGCLFFCSKVWSVTSTQMMQTKRIINIDQTAPHQVKSHVCPWTLLK